MTLYHYTCDHSVERIRRDGFLRPNRHPSLGARLVWLTDLDTPDRDALGLTSQFITCDRTKHRFTVADESFVVPWTEWAREHKVSHLVRDYLEQFGLPRHWFVSEHHVVVA